MPGLFIITGSNGAGKSSIGQIYLPEEIQDSVFDGDKLYMTKKAEFWKNGIKSPKECSRLALQIVETTFFELVNSALDNNTDFAYEGHFTNDATWDVPKRFKANGYTINLIFFGLTDTDLSKLRVAARTKEGGHNVDPLTLNNNFYGNLEKLDIYYTILDSLRIFDTSSEHIELVSIENNKITCFESDFPNWFTDNLKNIYNQIKK